MLRRWVLDACRGLCTNTDWTDDQEQVADLYQSVGQVLTMYNDNDAAVRNFDACMIACAVSVLWRRSKGL